MAMRGRTTFGLLCVALVLAGYVYWLQQREPDSGHRVIRFNADRIDAFEVTLGDWVVRGERDGQTWGLIHPLEAAADPAAVERMLAGFETLDRHTALSRRERLEQGMELDAFGLQQPRARIVLWAAGDRHAFWVGQRTALEDRVYLLDEVSEDVLSVSESLLAVLPDSPDALRERRLFPPEPARVHRMELTRPEGFVQWVRQGADRWRIQQPADYRADAGKVRELASSILDAKAESFVRDGTGDDTPFGFDEVGVSATVTLDRPDAPVRRIDIGAAVPDRPDERYARVGHRAGIVTVSDTLHARLREGVDAFRDRRLLPVSTDSIQEIHVQIGAERLELNRDGAGRWALVSPVSAPADPARVGSFLDQWAETRIERFLPAADPESMEPTERRIRFHVRDPDVSPDAETRSAGFEIEPPDPEGLIPLRCPDSGRRVAVHPLRLRGFSVDPLEFVTRRPLYLDPAHVRGFTIRHAGREWTVSRNDAGQLAWGRGEEESGPLDEMLARKQLALLLELPRARPVSWGAHAFVDQRLAEPETVIRIYLADEAELGKTLFVGGHGADGVYVRVGDQDLTYAVDPVVANTLRRRPVQERR